MTSTPSSQATPSQATTAHHELPTWNLSDLYPDIGSSELKTDIAWVDENCKNFETRYKGNLQKMLADDAEGVGQAIVAFEAIEERMGRILSFAGLQYAGDASNPAFAKFYGDMQEKMTAASSHLLFFALELNRLEENLIAEGIARSPTLARYAPWLSDLRQEKPHQLDDRIEQLFHEKSITGAAAWTRLFDETMTSLRFTIGGKEMVLEAALNLLQDSDRAKRQAAFSEIGRVLSANGRLFTQITNTLAKDKQIADSWRKFADPADSRHLSNRVEGEVVRRSSRRYVRHSRACRTAITN